jgi:hypothetical protein
MTEEVGPDSIHHARLHDQLMNHTYAAYRIDEEGRGYAEAIRTIHPGTEIFRLVFYRVTRADLGKENLDYNSLPRYNCFDYTADPTFRLVTRHGVHAVGQALSLTRAGSHDEANVILSVVSVVSDDDEEETVLVVSAKGTISIGRRLQFFDTVSSARITNESDGALLEHIQNIDCFFRVEGRKVIVVKNLPKDTISMPVFLIPDQKQFPPKVHASLTETYGTREGVFRLPPDHHCFSVLYRIDEANRLRMKNPLTKGTSFLT